MKRPGWWHFAVSDALRWLLLPALAALLPAGAARRLLHLVAAWRGLVPEIDEVEQTLDTCFPGRSDAVADYARTMLIEAMTLWRIRFGLSPRLEVHGEWPEHPGFAAVGGHFGNGIAVLWHLRQAGLKPRFLFRPPAADWKRTRPVFWLWSRVRYGVVMRLCDAQPMTTGGARSKLAAVLGGGDATPVILLDTPAEPGSRETRLRLGRRRICLREGASAVLAESGCTVVMFVPRIDGANTRLELRTLDTDTDSPAEVFADRFAQELERVPGQWHSWPGIGPSLESGVPDDPSPIE